uniref:Uncharacterized protein n=1 Tax=Pinguiococcus pyrenoidosus TaxID=172671 RepID=A0A7R9YCT1_9STRA
MVKGDPSDSAWVTVASLPALCLDLTRWLSENFRGSRRPKASSTLDLEELVDGQLGDPQATLDTCLKISMVEATEKVAFALCGRSTASSLVSTLSRTVRQREAPRSGSGPALQPYDDLACAHLLIVLTERLLREAFVRCMDDQTLSSLASASDYFITLDGIGQRHLHPVLLDVAVENPRRHGGGPCDLNPFLEILGDELYFLMLDLHVHEHGPHLRARLAHGDYYHHAAAGEKLCGKSEVLALFQCLLLPLIGFCANWARHHTIVDPLGLGDFEALQSSWAGYRVQYDGHQTLERRLAALRNAVAACKARVSSQAFSFQSIDDERTAMLISSGPTAHGEGPHEGLQESLRLDVKTSKLQGIRQALEAFPYPRWDVDGKQAMRDKASPPHEVADAVLKITEWFRDMLVEGMPSARHLCWNPSPSLACLALCRLRCMLVPVLTFSDTSTSNEGECTLQHSDKTELPLLSIPPAILIPRREASRGNAPGSTASSREASEPAKAADAKAADATAAVCSVTLLRSICAEAERVALALALEYDQLEAAIRGGAARSRQRFAFAELNSMSRPLLAILHFAGLHVSVVTALELAPLMSRRGRWAAAELKRLGERLHRLLLCLVGAFGAQELRAPDEDRRTIPVPNEGFSAKRKKSFEWMLEEAKRFIQGYDRVLQNDAVASPR